MKDANGNDVLIGDSVWFIPKPIRQVDILLKGVVTKVTAKTIIIESEWWWSRHATDKSVMEFRRNPNNCILISDGDTACLKCKSTKGV